MMRTVSNQRQDFGSLGLPLETGNDSISLEQWVLRSDCRSELFVVC